MKVFKFVLRCRIILSLYTLFVQVLFLLSKYWVKDKNDTLNPIHTNVSYFRHIIDHKLLNLDLQTPKEHLISLIKMCICVNEIHIINLIVLRV